jgi:outer membrane protein TolC
VQLNGLVGAIGARADVGGRNHNFGLRGTESGSVSAGWSIGLSSFGNLRTARAGEQSADIDARQKLQAVRSEVVLAQQESAAQSALIPKAREQLNYAQDALRLARANLRAGAMTTLDVLRAQSVLAQARLRYSTALLRYNQSQVNLLAAIGILDNRSLFPGIDEYPSSSPRTVSVTTAPATAPGSRP